MSVVLDTEKWSRQEFGACDLGDIRRDTYRNGAALPVVITPDAMPSSSAASGS